MKNLSLNILRKLFVVTVVFLLLVFITQNSFAQETGWYIPRSAVSSSANNCGGGTTEGDNSYAIFDISTDDAQYSAFFNPSPWPGTSLSIPPEKVIRGMEVSLVGYRTAASDFQFKVYLKGYDVENWTVGKSTTGLTNTTTTQVLGSPNDNWGLWSYSHLTDPGFDVKVSVSGTSGEAWLDAVKVKVYYGDPILPFIVTTSGKFKVPAEITSLTAKAWGGGGGGGYYYPLYPGQGGGGGGYIRGTFNVTSGQLIDIIVGDGGIGGITQFEGGNGNLSKVTWSSGSMTAAGGKGGGEIGSGGGIGGNSSFTGETTNTSSFLGGDGAFGTLNTWGSPNNGGGGGGGAGDSTNGVDASGASGGAGGIQSGGNGGNGSTDTNAGGIGQSYGGGGGGGSYGGLGGGKGGNGAVILLLPCTEPSVSKVSANPSLICNGTTTTLSVEGSLGEATAWKWYNGSCGGALAGSGTSITVSPTETTTYYVRGEGGCATPGGTCSEVTVTVNSSITPKVTILSSLPGDKECESQKVNITFTANTSNTGGGDVSYIWYKNGNPIDGVTTNTLYDNSEIEDGDVVSCVITVTGNTSCLSSPTATSNEIITRVYPDVRPTVRIESTDPDNEICDGAYLTFTAIPGNTNGGEVSYLWYRNGDPIESYDKNTLSNNGESKNGDVVSCEITVTNGACFGTATASSNEITITVNPYGGTATTTTPTICHGETAVLTLTDYLGSIQWQYSDGSSDPVDVIGGTGSTSSVYTTPPLTEDTYFFAKVNGGTCPPTYSNEVLITVNTTTPSVAITSSAPINEICYGAEVTFTATPTNIGGGKVSYQWKKNGEPIGSDQNTYKYDKLLDGDLISCEITVTGAACLASETAASNVIKMAVEATPVIDNPGPQAANGSYPLPTITGKNLVNAKYYNNSQASGGSVITGPITSNMTVWIYDATVNGCSDEESFLVTINALLAAPKVGTITQPTCSSSTGSVALSGLPSSGTWTLTGKSSIGTVTKKGSRSTTTVSGLSAGTTYTFIVTNASGSSSLPSGDVVINPQPQAPDAPAVGSQSFCGSATEADLPHRNGTYSYKWYSSSTSRSSLSSSTRLSTGIYYVSQVSGDCESSRTIVIVTINALPTVFRVSGSGTYCGNGPALTVKLSGSRTGVNYQLYLNGSPVAGAIIPGTGSAISFINQFLEGTYTVKAVNAITNCQATMADRAVITVSETPTASSLAYSRSSASNCNNSGSATIILLSATPGGRYTSAPSGLSINSSTGTINFARSNPGTYTVTYTVSNTCGTAKTTTTVTVTKCTYKNEAISNSEPLIQVIDPNSVKFKVYPNPFSDRLRFEFISPVNVNARIDVYDITGRMVKIVFNSPVEAGVTYIAEFKPNSAVNSIFLYSVTIGDEKYIGKVIYKK